MKSSRSKSRKRKSIIDSIRRPLAPPGHPLTQAKPAGKARARPAGRKAKHKQRPEKLELEEEY